MTRSTTQAVVFDIDDTLYLERDYVRSGFRAVGEWARQALGIVDLADRAWAAFEAGLRATIFDVAVAHDGAEVPPELISQLVACYRAHVPDIELLEDARFCLERLALDPDVEVGFVTDGPSASQYAKVLRLGLSSWSELIIYTDELGPGFGKPHRRAFELIEEKLAVTGERCAYVADNPAKDFAGPHQLGWTTIRVRREHGLHFHVPSGEDVDHEATDLAAVLALLRPEVKDRRPS
jgi:putative hydrolase of the HAD superfamily